ncbi:sulfotransferase family protein [Mangrovicoccus algicola]|uniref:Sulfotransferase n=1 Tax=Mangrovicoccus algicola TaxID=2771008 RepID=A0A8J6Z4W7_9RHOB|nr:hypothetical protein [Mangrovicoccus algicola]MBE3636716.1 hypothetical protein [Mangrovicoccus algicola]
MTQDDRVRIVLAHFRLWDPKVSGTAPARDGGLRLLDAEGAPRWRIIPGDRPEAEFWSAIRNRGTRQVRKTAGALLLRRDLTPAETEALWRREDALDPQRAVALFALAAGEAAADEALRRPDFLILGTMKGGTTSLYDHICRHPRVAARRPKEIHYFSLRRDLGEDWYRGFFAGKRPGELTGEASPSYFDIPRPDIPARIRAMAPRAHLFAILADPARRAVSEYYHNLRIARNAAPDSDFIRPQDVLTAERARADLAAGASYLRTGFYETRLPLWREDLDAGRMTILTQRALKADPVAVTQQAWAALGLSPVPLGPDKLRVLNRNSYPAPDAGLQEFLSDLYAGTVAAMQRDYGVTL